MKHLLCSWFHPPPASSIQKPVGKYTLFLPTSSCMMSNAPHNSWAMCTHDYTYFVVKCKLSENKHKLEPVNWFNYKEETTVTKQGQLRTGSNSDRLIITAATCPTELRPGGSAKLQLLIYFFFFFTFLVTSVTRQTSACSGVKTWISVRGRLAFFFCKIYDSYNLNMTDSACQRGRGEKYKQEKQTLHKYIKICH